MHLYQLTLLITKSPEEYTGNKHLEMPENGGSLGRHPSNTVSLIDHNRFISGSHCLISIYGDTYYLSDVSTNGTLINGNKLLKNQPVSLYHGDLIILGRYEISVNLEKLSNNINIAVDISDEIDSTDPLINLAEYQAENEEEKGSISDLFIETRTDKLDNSDPVAHLNLMMKNDDNILLRDDAEENTKSTNKASFQNRQLLDDNECVHSGFDAPNLIPEDWYPHDLTPTIEPPSKPITQPIVPKQTQTSSNTQAWEDVTQAIQPKDIIEEQKEPPRSNIEVITKSNPNQYINEEKLAFCKGLGIPKEKAEQMNEHLFQQMGTCLRLCIDDLQKKLTELKTLKESETSTEITDIIELIFSLHEQQLLAPNELIEQILDELESHKIKVAQATNEVLNQKLQALDPNQFSHIRRSQSRLKSNGKLWKEYLAFHALHSDEKIDISSQGIQQKIKENYTKGTNT